MRGSLQRIPAVYVELNQEGFCGRDRSPGKWDWKPIQPNQQQQASWNGMAGFSYIERCDRIWSDLQQMMCLLGKKY